jgi:hypothetical protein
MPRRAVLSALALTASVSILAGCGSSSSGSGGSTGSGGGTATNNSSAAPLTELTGAIDALSNASTISATLKLGATGSQLQSFVHEQDPTSKLTAAQANAIVGAQIEIETSAPSGKTLGDLSTSNGAGAVNLTISDQGSSLFTLRVVSKTLYFQVDLKDLLNKLGQSSTFAQIQAASAQLPAFVQALLKGNWVSLPEATAKSLSSELGASSGSSTNQAQANALLAKLKALLTKDVTVTRTSSGSTDVLTLSGNTRTLANDFVTEVASSIPGAGAALGSADLSKVPSKTLTATASVTGGALAGIGLDLGQFAKSGHGSLPIDLAIGRSGSAITAPSGAVPVDTSSLGQLLGAFGGGGL